MSTWLTVATPVILLEKRYYVGFQMHEHIIIPRDPEKQVDDRDIGIVLYIY